MSNKDRELAHQTQEKFEFYIISLIFTLLALSIQTSTFGISEIADIFELLGWALLLIAGIFGLWRMEYKSSERVKVTQKQEFENKIFDMQQLIQQGEHEIFVLETNRLENITERIRSFQEAISVLDPIIVKIDKENSIKYTVHRYTFISGLVFLLLSRGYIPVSNLLEQLCNYFT